MPAEDSPLDVYLQCTKKSSLEGHLASADSLREAVGREQLEPEEVVIRMPIHRISGAWTGSAMDSLRVKAERFLKKCKLDLSPRLRS